MCRNADDADPQGPKADLVQQYLAANAAVHGWCRRDVAASVAKFPADISESERAEARGVRAQSIRGIAASSTHRYERA
jgi:hypothetical protein